MNVKFLMLLGASLLLVPKAKAQFAVIDPANIATSIVNATKQVVETSATAATMAKNFNETVKIFEQGKQYYDALKAVNTMVRDARKVQQTILMVGEISEIYVTSFQKMMGDPHYSVQELGAIAYGYTKLLEEGSSRLVEMKDVVTPGALQMNDKERLDIIDRSYNEVKRYRNLVGYYTNKNIAVSYLRSKKAGDTDRVLALYGKNERYW